MDFLGTSGNDVINGTVDDDIIYTLGGKDTISASDGNDLIVVNGPLAAGTILNGGNGTDTVAFTSAAAVTLAPGVTGVLGVLAQISGVETFKLDSQVGETLRVILSYGQATPGTTIEGGSGMDALVLSVPTGGGAFSVPTLNFVNWSATDIVGLSAANQTAGYMLQAGSYTGAVSLNGGNAGDTLLGGVANDFLGGNAGDDVLDGGAGNDVLQGGAGADVLSGGAGDDTLTGGSEADLFQPSLGHDVVSDFVVGTDKVDLRDVGISNFAQLQAYMSQSGSDAVFSVLFDGVVNTLTLQNVNLSSLSAADFLFHDASAITVTGTDNADTLFGAAGADTLTGNGGNDIIYTGGGKDTVDAGAGDDTIVLDAAPTGGTVINGGTGFDTIVVPSTAVTPTVNNGLTYSQVVLTGLASLTGVENIAFGSTVDTGVSVVLGLWQAGSVTTLEGGAGNDSFVLIAPGAGTYTLGTYARTNWTDATQPGGPGDVVALVAGSAGNYVLNASAGHAGVEVLIGSQSGGADILNGSDGMEVLIGNAGDDVLNGNGGADKLDGGAGADVLGGGAGDDTLTGGSEADLFQPSLGHDVVTDFVVGTDKVDLRDVGISSFAQLRAYMSQSGSDAVFSVLFDGVVNTLTLQNVNLSSLSASDFVFHDASAITVTGTDNADTLFGAAGADTLSGNGGNDIIYTGGGKDTVDAGAGDDTIVLDAAPTGGTVINGGTGFDTLAFTSGAAVPLGNSGVTGVLGIITQISNIEVLHFASGAGETLRVVLNYGQAPNGLTVEGDAGTDIMLLNLPSGGGVFNVPTFNFANWSATDIVGLSAANQAVGYTLQAGSYAGAVSLIGGNGNDNLLGGVGNDFLGGNAGDDILIGAAGDDRIDGGVGTDIAAFSGNRADYLVAAGSTGEVLLTGTDGSDTVLNVEVFRFDDGDYQWDAGTQTLVPVAPIQTLQGAVFDGYISGATVFVDHNANGILDADEPFAITDASGNFQLLTNVTGPLRAVGGTNVDTGLPNQLVLSAPDGATVVNPLTTLVQAIVENNPGIDLAHAQDLVADAFGIDTGIDLNTFDMLSQTNDPDALAAQKAAASINLVLEKVLANDPGSDAGAQTAGLGSMANLVVNSTGAVDLSDTTTLGEVLQGALPDLPPEQIAMITTQTQSTLETIANAQTLDQISSAQETANHDPIAGTAASLSAGVEDTVYQFTAQDLLAGFSDVDGDALSVTTPTADHGTVIDNGNGTYTLVPTSNYSGSIQLSYAVTDGHGGSTAAILPLTLTAVNDAPVFTSPTAVSVPENSTAVLNLVASDIDSPQQFTYELVGGVDKNLFAVDASGGVTFKTAPDFEAPGDAGGNNIYDLVVRVTDAGGAYSDQALTVTVTDVIETPTRTVVLTSRNDNFVGANGINWIVDAKAGDDTITTGDGNDVVRGNSGDDSISTGSGNDIITFQGAGEGYDRINGGAGTDRVLALAADTVIGLKSVAGIEIISAGGYANVSIQGGNGADSLDFSSVSLDGIVRIDGGSGNDSIIGSAGNDTIYGNAGNDTINAGAGDDVIQFGVASADTINGGVGNDTLQAVAANASVQWNQVSSIEAVDGHGYAGVTLNGTGGNDILDFSAVTLTGIARVDAGAGNDTVIGSSGTDVLLGGTGRDVLTGGLGSDSFLFTSTAETAVGANADRILDFTQGQDRIDLSAIDASTKASGNQAFSFIGTNAFSGAGQLRMVVDAAHEVTKVYGDVNGDKIADFEIDIAWIGHTPMQLTGGDFIL